MLRLDRMLATRHPATTSREPIADAVAELLACFPVYRSYLPLGRGAPAAAAAERTVRTGPTSRTRSSDLLPVLADPRIRPRSASSRRRGMVMAKGVEDTAFYRYTRLGSLTEVGGDPSEFSIDVAEFHARAAAAPGSGCRCR